MRGTEASRRRESGFFHGTLAGWNWHLWHGASPCAKCTIALERDLADKRRRFIMRWFGNGRYV